MFDTMTLTKVGAAVFGAWLVLLLGKWAGEEVYHAELHGEASYVIEVETAEAEPEEEIDFGALMAAADPDAGERVFRKCSACHQLNGNDGVGPHLNGVVDRAVASVAGFGYSGALESQAEAWTVDALNGFLEKPASWAPGTSMGFSGLSKPEDRADVIAYLQGTSE